MFATRKRGVSRARLLSLALVGGMALGATASSPEILALANPATSSSSMPRPSVSAPSVSAPSVSAPGVSAPGVAAQTAVQSLAMLTQGNQVGVSAQSRVAHAITRAYRGYLSSWTPVPGHPSYGMHDFAGDPYSSSFGQCTWYAWYRHRRLPLMRLGDAGSWPANARLFGLRVSSRPVRGATVIFSPGVQGASSVGHAGVVERVLRGGWLMISEMNFYWNGGGWGRVDYRYVHVGAGVTFII